MEKKFIYMGLGVLGIAATIGTVYYINNRSARRKSESTDTSLEGSSGKDDKLDLHEAGAEEQGSIKYKKSEKITPTTLVIGSKGRPVGVIQAYMNYKYGTTIAVDGKYGTELRDALRDKLGWYCGAYGGLGDLNCTIKSTESPAKDAIDLLKKKDKNFLNYFMKVYPPVGREYEPATWGGVGFTAKY